MENINVYQKSFNSVILKEKRENPRKKLKLERKDTIFF